MHAQYFYLHDVKALLGVTFIAICDNASWAKWRSSINSLN